MTEIRDNNSTSKVQKLKDLVNYQDGSIVSREIIRRNTRNNNALLAFNEGQGLSEHTAPFDALVYKLKGRSRFFSLVMLTT